MIKHVGDTLTTPYNPKNPDTKPPAKLPRDMVRVKLILGGRESEFPLSWFHVVWIYSLVCFAMTQGEMSHFDFIATLCDGPNLLNYSNINTRRKKE